MTDSTSVARSFFAVAFLFAVCGVGVALLPAVRKTVGTVGAWDAPAALRTKLPEEFPCKYWFVDLNGGASRMVGRRICNERILCSDGSLDVFCDECGSGVGQFFASTAALADSVKRLGIPFLYVQAPCKQPLDGGLMPAGWPHSNPNEVALRIEGELASHGVRTLDLIRVLASSREDTAANFYRTDHHWRGRAAFKAAKLVARELADVLGDSSLRNPPQLRIRNWESRVEKGVLLGSHGRRTGRLFAGTDDFEYFVPKFNTNIRRYMYGKLLASGEFEKSVLDLRVLEKGLHEGNAYAVYGNDRNEVVYVNKKARSKKRILFVKDSYANPLVDFLATVCSEVVKVDPRRCSSGEEIVRIVEKRRPDAVVMLVHPYAMWNENFILSDLLP